MVSVNSKSGTDGKCGGVTRDDAKASASASAGKRKGMRVKPSVMIVVSGVIVAAFVVLAIIAPGIWKGAAEATDPGNLFAKPSGAHPFGTDALGRDILARTLVATRVSLGTALLCTAIAAVAGIIIGIVPAVIGKRAQRISSSIINVWLAFPVILLAMLTVIAMGSGAVASVTALAITMTPSFARLAQTLTAQVAGRDYMVAGRMLGISRGRLFTRYVLPEVVEPFLVDVAQSVGGAILAMSSLSFLGMGVQAPEYDWGSLINDGFDQVYVSPMAAIGPGIFIVIAGLAFSMLGEGISDAIRATFTPPRPALSKTQLANPPRMVDKTNMGVVIGLAAERTRQHRDDVIAGRGQSDGDAAAAATDTGTRVSVPRSEPLLSVRGLTVSFAEGHSWNTPVRGISFDVEPGQIVGLVGESGSGKSLTMMSVADLPPAGAFVTADSMRFNGKELIGMSAEEKRKHLMGMGVVFQDSLTALNPSMRVGTQLAEVLECQTGMRHGEAMKRAVDMLHCVGIAPDMHAERKFPHELSGGMRQRVLIAMAQINHPRLIIADEPTTALDVTVQKQVLGLLRNECAANNQAAVIVSHDIAVLGEICQSIMVMYHGAIVEIFDTALLRTPERLRHPYTRALVRSIPTLDTDRSKPLETIDAEMVSQNAKAVEENEAAASREAAELMETAEKEALA